MRRFTGWDWQTIGNSHNRVIDLITIVTNGHTYRWTNADQNMVGEVNESGDWSETGYFHGLGPLVKRGRIMTTVGTETSTLEIELLTGGQAMIGPDPIDFDWMSPVHIAEAAAKGAFDNARVYVHWGFLEENAIWSDYDWWLENVDGVNQIVSNWYAVGTMLMFMGFVGEVNPTPGSVRLTVKSPMERLKQKFPRNTFQPKCHWQLYGRGCGVDRFATDSLGAPIYFETSWAGPDSNQLAVQNQSWWGSGAPEVRMDFLQSSAWIEFAPVDDGGGMNAGLRRQVVGVGWNNDYLLSVPLPYVPQDGDAFMIYMGCNKSGEKWNTAEVPYVDFDNDCALIFNNQGRCRAFPQVPTDLNVYKKKSEE